jgi:pimeloyl-ACP methyl ester carboxylesterase
MPSLVLTDMTSSTILLIPGAGGDPSYWHLVAPRLRDHGHAVHAVDLPGPDDTKGLHAYTDVVVDAAAGAGGRLVLVAHSMGAYPASMAAARISVDLIVLVAPMIPAPGESPGAFWDASGQSAAYRENERAEGRDPDVPADLLTLFFHDVPQPTIDAAFARGNREESERVFHDPWPLDAWPAVPTRMVACARDRLFPLGLQRRLARERLDGLEPDVIDAGHLPALGRPHELAAYIASCIDGAASL